MKPTDAPHRPPMTPCTQLAAGSPTPVAERPHDPGRDVRHGPECASGVTGTAYGPCTCVGGDR